MRAQFYEVRPAKLTDDRLLDRTMTLEVARARAESISNDEGPVRIIRVGDGWSEAVETVHVDEERA